MADYYIGQVFQSVYPPDCADWCSSRGDCYIKEIGSRGGKRRFEIVAVPAPTDDEIAVQVRKERDDRLNAVEWRVDRYRDQRDQGIVTTDTAEQYQAVLVYMQALRDIPSQEGFPRNVVFPVLPTFLQ